MGKHLKLNIKNTQLAGVLKVQRKDQIDTAESAPKKRVSRLKEDASVATAVKQAEKTGASKEKEPVVEIPKRKARIMKESPGTVKLFSEEEPAAVETPSRSPFSEEEEVPAARPQATPVQEVTTPPVAPPAATAPSSSAQAPYSESRQAPRGPFPPAKAPSKELKPQKKEESKKFDSRDRQGLRDVDNEAWRKRRQHKPIKRSFQEEPVIRPKTLAVRIPITIKDLAQEMKLKASQLIAKLFMKGVVMTLNDFLDDETTIQLLGHDFDCEITIDTSEEQRLRITDETIKKEIGNTLEQDLILRPPVITFMGHVDHGKTSLIDAIRKSNRAASEAGAITQHIGAFKVDTAAGSVTILDTPGHEAFSEMRSRGANVTDIVVLVVAGDEGIRAQTEEAIRQAREAKVPILVAINKCDKPNFDAQKVYRELADRDLLPEAWGGTIITVNCSATTSQGIKELLEMIALQAEVLELRANPNARARGSVLESEMHKGLGAVATVLIQNGTLRKNDAIVFGSYFGRIKTMQDDHFQSIDEAGPSTPVKITGLSDLALAGSEFIVVKSEKEARQLAADRAEGALRSAQIQAKISSLDRMMAKKESGEMKILPLILRADVQGSLEALRNSLLKIQSKKVRIEIVNTGVGEISESDIELAAASKATIIGFHTHIESRANELIKEKKIAVISHDVIYHLLDEVKVRMQALLDKLQIETDTAKVLVKAIFKSSQLGQIAGCQVAEGTIKRGSLVRQIRGKEVIWKGRIGSLKRMKEDVKEVKEGFECGILLDGQTDIQEGDLLQAYEITYLEQEI